MKRRWIWGGAVVVVIILVVAVWQTKIIQRINQRINEQQFLGKVEQLKNAWRNDTVGGVTPEETLSLFISAFKTGDLELASKYFVVDKQAEFLAKMQNWVKLGKSKEIIKSLENSKMLGTLRENSFVADMGEIINGEILHDIEFLKNEFSNKWKINNL